MNFGLMDDSNKECNLIRKKSFRFLLYGGLILVSAFYMLMNSFQNIKKVNTEFAEKIEILKSSVADEKRGFIKNAVENAITTIDIIRGKAGKTTDKKLNNETKKFIEDKIRKFRLLGNGYIWINRIENYGGGEYYAVREIAPDFPQKEGSWLSTEIEDITGRKPYKVELDGLKKRGEVFYEHYLKKINSEDIDRRLIYAKLYKPYNWVVATGVYLDRSDYLIRKEIEKKDLLSQSLKRRSYLFSAFFAVSLLIMIYYFERKINHLIHFQSDEIKKRSNIINGKNYKDPLTGLSSRDKLNEFLIYEIAKAKRYSKEFSIILMDLDNFRKINDSVGYNKGDKIIRKVATLLKRCLRSVDIVGRWQGDEFLIICSETDINGAMHLAEKIRQTVYDANFPISNRVTASFGVSTFCERDNSETIINRADRALYRAKEFGRNRVE